MLYASILATLVNGIWQANLMGSGSGLYFSYYLEKYHRHRKEVICDIHSLAGD
jgi:hypothetical protein